MECNVYDVFCVIEWTLDEAYLLFLYALNEIMTGLVFLIDLIPVPDFMLLSSVLSFSSSSMFYIDLFKIDVGVGIMVSAYTARFLIRRLPFIG